MPTAKTRTPIEHDHDACLITLQAQVEARAEVEGLKLTPLRQAVFEIVAASHAPMGAYAILEQLSQARIANGKRAAPPTVYRALDYLLSQGLVHRIDSLNAFVACFQPERHHRAYFLICVRCGVAQEIRDAALEAQIGAIAARQTFKIEKEAVEVSGICAQCT